MSESVARGASWLRSRPGGGHDEHNRTRHPDRRRRRHASGPAHRSCSESRGRCTRHGVLLHHAGGLPRHAALVPHPWRAAAGRRGVHRLVWGRCHAPSRTGWCAGTGGYRSRPVRAARQGQGRHPGRDRGGRGGAHRAPRTGGQGPIWCCGGPARATHDAQDGDKVSARNPAATAQHYRRRARGGARPGARPDADATAPGLRGLAPGCAGLPGSRGGDPDRSEAPRTPRPRPQRRDRGTRPLHRTAGRGTRSQPARAGRRRHHQRR